MAVTIHDLARMAGTSTATISRVLAGKRGVGAAKREAILRLAQEVGYTPNRIAQNLALNKSHVIGLVAAALDNPAYVDFFRRIHRAVQEKGYRVLIADSELDVEKERQNIATMREHRAEGLIVFPVHDWRATGSAEHFLHLRIQKFPVVIVGRLDDHGLDAVTSEQDLCGATLTRHLLELGHRDIAFVGSDPSNRCIAERQAGVQRTLAEAGLALRPENIVADRPGWVGQFEAVLRRPDRPTAVVYINDVCALMAHPMLLRLGLRLPEDLSQVAFDDSIWSRYLTPSLTTTAERIEEVTARTLQMLFARMEDPEAPAVRHRVAQEVIFRNSTAPPPR